jgi:hypothetical protein
MWQEIGNNFYENQDFHIHVVLEQAASSKRYKAEQYGVIWGAVDAKNNLSFLITDDGNYQICECENGEWKSFTGYKNIDAVNKGDAVINILDIRRVKESVEFYINSHLVEKLPAQKVMKVKGQNLGFLITGDNAIKVHSLVITSADGAQQATGKVEVDGKLKASSFEHEPSVEDTLEKIFKDLDLLIGHHIFKSQFRALANSLKVQAERRRRGLKIIDPPLHIVLLGPPGTGKTTIARLVGRLYKQLGYLQRGHVVETDRAGLVGVYLGQTAHRVNDAVEQALEGVLFIDEAYALVTNGGSSNDYGHEVVQTLLKRMEDKRSQLAVIVAGYTEEMKFFVDSNPGLKSRFGQFFHFEHYTPDELILIFEQFCHGNDYALDGSANERILEMFEAAYEARDKSFGNGRYVRNVFEYSVGQQANRISSQLEGIDDISISLITAADLKSPTSGPWAET